MKVLMSIVQTSTTIAADLAQILHGAFTGTIEALCERGAILNWEVNEVLKGGRIPAMPTEPATLARVTRDLEALLADEGRAFTGRLVLHCNSGSVARYGRHRSLLPGQLVPLAEAAAALPSGAKRGKSLS